LRSARIAGYALKSRSTWPTGGSASWALRTGSPIILSSPVRGMNASGRATMADLPVRHDVIGTDQRSSILLRDIE
jgi:hypothetical protein